MRWNKTYARSVPGSYLIIFMVHTKKIENGISVFKGLRFYPRTRKTTGIQNGVFWNLYHPILYKFVIKFTLFIPNILLFLFACMGGRPVPIVLVKWWKVAYWNAKKLLKNCQKSKKLLPKFQKLLPKSPSEVFKWSSLTVGSLRVIFVNHRKSSGDLRIIFLKQGPAL